MARPFNLEISESTEYLSKSLKNARTAIEKERLQMIWWLKTGQVTQHKELSRILGRDASTVTRWLAKLLEVNVAPGAMPKIQGEVLSELKEKLQCPQGFSSYGQIVEWLEQKFNMQVKYKTVYRWVRYELKATLKVPRPVSKEQDEQAVSQFKKTFPLPY